MRKIPVSFPVILAVLFALGLLAGCSEGGKQPAPAPPPAASQQSAAPGTPPGVVGAGAAKPQSCYDIGFKTGRCAAKSMSNLPCEPGEDIPMPAECKGKPETEKGLAEGRKSVY